MIAQCFAQDMSKTNGNSQYLIRSTVGNNGFSNTITTNSGAYFIQQSIGQASVIGTYCNNKHTIRQGFLQPLYQIDINSLNIFENNLESVLYPNPFNQSINISFNKYIVDDMIIVIYNMSGTIVYLNKYSATQKINIPLNYLPNGEYLLKATINDKDLVSKLIKY